MKIKELNIKHFKGARNVEIHANPKCNEISGPNGAGKSSIIDAIIAAIGGARVIPPKPISDGEGKGEIILITDDGWSVVKRFSEGKNTRIDIAHNGTKKGQRDLDNFITDFTFDPLAFCRMPFEKQIIALKTMLGEEFQNKLVALDTDIADKTNERLLLGRIIKNYGEIKEVIKTDPVDIADITQELKVATKWNADQEIKQNQIYQHNIKISKLKKYIAKLEQELSTKKCELEETLTIELPEPMQPKDIAEYHNKLVCVGNTNRAAMEYETYKGKIKEKQNNEEKYENLTKEIEKAKSDKERLFKKAKFPIDGVTFSDQLRIAGIPFEQLSSSEKIEISAKIGASINNKLKIMLIKDGSLLDQISYDILLKVAGEKDIQLWIETVGNGHGDSIHIEEGEIKC